jgi:ribosome biogenesis GTPase A
MKINWYPGHMAKTRREIAEKLALIDIVYEVIDARMPYSSKIKDIDNLLKAKPKVLIMTKIDLCDMTETNKWIKYYEDKGYKVVGVDLLNIKGLSKILDITKELMIEKDSKREEKGMMKRKYRVLVMGIPNVGKSTLINRLVGKKIVEVGNRPGITKHLGWIRINDQLELLDSPGILWPKLDEETVALNLASLTAIKEEILPLDDVSVYILNTLHKYYPDYLVKRYGIEDIDNEDICNTLDIIGKKRGCLISRGEVDYDKVYTVIINDLKEGSFGNVTFDRCKN